MAKPDHLAAAKQYLGEVQQLRASIAELAKNTAIGQVVTKERLTEVLEASMGRTVNLDMDYQG
jgi:hypothetical protein